LRSADFDYPLPAERIAQEPLTERDASRLLHVVPGGGLEDREPLSGNDDRILI